MHFPLSNRISRLASGQPEWVAGIIVVLLALTVYIATLANGLRMDELLGGDVITHHYAQVEGRPANTPGYPIYTMLGWLWFRVGSFLFPWFNPTEVLSTFSTVWALASLAVLYAILLKVTSRWPIAFLVSAFYAFTYLFWYYSITSEEYTSAVLQTLLFIWWALRWQETGADRYLLYSAINVGLCLANLLTVLAIVPALVIFYLAQEPRLLRRGRLMARGFGLGLLPLLSYAYVFLAGLFRPEWRGEGEWANVWHWFFNFLVKQAREELSLFFGQHPEQFPWLVASELTWVVLTLSILGGVLLGAHRTMLFYATLFCYLIVGYITRHANWYQVIIPVYPVLLLGFGAMVAGAWEQLPPRLASVGRATLLLGLTTLVVGRFVAIYPEVNQRDLPEYDAIPLARSLIHDHPREDALIFGTFKEIAALRYLIVVWGERTDLQTIETVGLKDWLEGRDSGPLYVTRKSAWLLFDELKVHPPLSSAGRELIEVLREPRTTLPAGIITVHEPFIEGITLAGIDCFPSEDETLHVALYWQVSTPAKATIVSLRPLDGGDLIYRNGRLASHDHHPVWNTYPFDKWVPGEAVRDDYLVKIPAGVMLDGVQLIAYRPIDDGSGTMELAECELSLPACREPAH